MPTPLTPADIQSHTLRSATAQVRLLSIGCAIQSWDVGGTNVVLGYANDADYIANPPHMGVLLGRVANRVGGAAFTLDGVTYALPDNDRGNCLHGGTPGFGHRNWTLTQADSSTAVFTLVSEDGDQGFPGHLEITARLTLSGHCLTYDITATPDRPTPINMAQHVYFNLMGTGDVMNHTLHLAASRMQQTGADQAPTGPIDPVAGTHYDYTTPRQLGLADPERQGCDASLILDSPHDPNTPLAPDADPAVATLTAPNGLRLRMWTDRPAVQLYTSPWLGAFGTPMPGQTHKAMTAVCLEAQDYVDAVNRPEYPSVIYGPDRPYRQVTSIEIAPQAG